MREEACVCIDPSVSMDDTVHNATDVEERWRLIGCVRRRVKGQFIDWRTVSECMTDFTIEKLNSVSFF